MQFKQSADIVINSLKTDLGTLRTGRVTPALIENLIVDTYQGQAKLRLLELAAISASDNQTLSVQPFDISTLKDIEKAILKSPLGLNPLISDNQITIKLPPLSQEQRQKILKIINQKIEEKKSHLRNQRDELRKKIRSQEEQKTITKDDKFRLEKELDREIQKYNEVIQEIKAKKEKEIMEV